MNLIEKSGLLLIISSFALVIPRELVFPIVIATLGGFLFLFGDRI